MKFKNDNGVPIISEFNFIEKNNFDIKIILQKTKLNTKLKKQIKIPRKNLRLIFLKNGLNPSTLHKKKDLNILKKIWKNANLYL